MSNMSVLRSMVYQRVAELHAMDVPRCMRSRAWDCDVQTSVAAATDL